jgi:outer membrane protein assembly factor BamB
MNAKKQVLPSVCLFAFSLCLCAFVANSLFAADWAHWRGPRQTGVSDDTGLPEKFSLNPKDANNNLLWTAQLPCRSTPIIMHGRVYIINVVGQGVNLGERVMCLDAETGQKIWEDKFNVFHSDIVASRVGWTNPAGDPETGYVYIHGTQGFLRCYDKDGKIVWDRNLTEEYGRVTGYGGRISSPTVADDVVVIGMINSSWGDFARGANRFVAFDKKTGKVAWWTALEGQMKGTYYSNPVVATIGEQRLLITGAADGGLHALQTKTGKLVWSYHFAGNVVNSSPVVDGNLVYCSHGEENEDTSEQGRLVCVDASQVENGHPKLVWQVTGTKFGYASPVIHDGRIYLANDSGRLFGFDAKTGKALGKKPNGELYTFGRLSRGSPVWADGKIYIFDVNGHFHILKPTGKGIEELHDQPFRALEGRGFVETNGTPAVYKGRLYFGTREQFYCVGTKEGKAAETTAPASQPKSGAAIAQLQAFPADVVLHPGATAQFQLRFFDANGEPVATATALPNVAWSIVTPPKTPAGLQPPPLKGELKDGAFTADKTNPGQQGYIAVAAGDLTARVRVRVAPTLPYKQDFEKVPVGATPGGWVNATGKFDVIEKDGGRVLRKLANSPVPPLARANAYITLPTTKDYVIQADVSGELVRDGLPDIAIVNSRYHLLLDGKVDIEDGKRRLRIASWEAMPRINHGVVFDWKPNTWYTLKLAVEYTEKTAKVRGKAWERGQTEPKEWTIEFEDPSPNREGAPALYAYVSNVIDKDRGSEAYFDNVVITPNKGGEGRAPGAKVSDLAAEPVRPKSTKEQLAESIKVRDNPRVRTASTAPAIASNDSKEKAPAAPVTAGPVLGTPVGPPPKEPPTDSGKAVVAQAIVVRDGGGTDESGQRRPVYRYVRLNIAFR